MNITKKNHFKLIKELDLVPINKQLKPKTMSKKKYVDGIRVFKPHKKAPEFIVADVIITPRELIDWMKDNAEHLTEYQGKKQFKLQITSGDSGYSLSINDFKPKETSKEVEEEDNLPF